jgi:hypothetical protein
MTAPSTLPRRDLWLLPLISLMTVIMTLAAAEPCTRLLWPEQPTDSCALPDPDLGYRMRPNCTSVMKAAEGPLYTALESIFESRYTRTAMSTFYVIAIVTITGLLNSPAPDVIYKNV